MRSCFDEKVKVDEKFCPSPRVGKATMLQSGGGKFFMLLVVFKVT